MANVIEVVLRARDQMSGALKKGSKNVAGFNKNILAMGVAAGAMSAAIILPMKRALAETMKFGDEIGKTVQRTGIAAESLSTLGFVAERSGANFAALANGLRRMAKAASDADEGLLESQRTFDNLNISIYDTTGKLKSMEVLMLEAADALSVMTDDTKKAAVAQELFGRGGMALLPMLNMGSAGIKDLQERARELGIELTGPQAQAWERIQDGVTDAQTAMKGLKMQIANALAPAFEMMVGKITKATAAMSKWMREHPGWTKAIIGLTVAIAGGMGLIAALAAIVAISGPVGAAWAVMMGPVGWVILALAAVGIAVYKFRSEIMDGMYKAADGFLFGIEKMLEGVGWLLEKMGVDWLDGAIASIKKARTSLQGTADDLLAGRDAAHEMAKAVDAIGSGDGARAGSGPPPWAGAGLAEIRGATTGTPAEAFMQLADAMELGGEKMLTFFGELLPEAITTTNDALTEAQEVLLEMGLTAEQMAEGIGNAFGTAFAQAIVYGEDMATSLKNAFKSWAAAAIQEITRVMAKMAALAALQYITGLPFTSFGQFIPTGGGSVPAGQSGWGANLASAGGTGPMLGGGTTNNYYISIPAIDSKSLRHDLRYGTLGRELARAVGR